MCTGDWVLNVTHVCCIETLANDLSLDGIEEQTHIVSNSGLHENRCHYIQQSSRESQQDAQDARLLLPGSHEPHLTKFLRVNF